MDAVTYPNEEVIHEINESFVPLKLECNFGKPTELMKKYHVRWTPTLYIVEPAGSPRFHNVGFLPPEELLGHLELILAMDKFDRGQSEAAMNQLHMIPQKYSATNAAPQAIYYIGVAKYKKTREKRYLKEMYQNLADRYPDTLWAKKASPYSEIQD